jgi:hypothetical protein
LHRKEGNPLGGFGVASRKRLLLSRQYQLLSQLLSLLTCLLPWSDLLFACMTQRALRRRQMLRVNTYSARRISEYISFEIRPTSAALRQHVLRAAYQAGQVWGRSLTDEDNVPSPADWGWVKKAEIWTPIWSELPEVWQDCRELDKCGCKTGCTSNRAASVERAIFPVLYNADSVNENVLTQGTVLQKEKINYGRPMCF